MSTGPVSGTVSAARRLWAASMPMTALGIASAVAAVAVLGVLGFDDRVVLGAPAWTKPLKFFVSTALYALTFAWLLTLPMRRRARTARAVAGVAAAAWTAELVLITVQAARGVPSHFNAGTGLDLAVFVAMGVTATLLWIGNLWVAALVVRDRQVHRVAAAAVACGLVLAGLGMAVAFLMPLQPGGGPADAVPLVIGAHAVGVPDGGPGLPLLGWTTDGGDLRVAHFVGLHGLQLMPVVAWLVGRRADRPEGQRRWLVLVVAAGYGALTLLLTWQALRGQPLLAPDLLTWTVLGALVVATGVAATAGGRADDAVSGSDRRAGSSR